MAYLFQINGRAVFPNAETILISPFKDIWERDLSKDKEIQQLYRLKEDKLVNTPKKPVSSFFIFYQEHSR